MLERWEFVKTKWIVGTFAMALVAGGCGGDGGGGGDPDATGPTDVAFGETALVVVLNPVVNDANQANLPTPGTVRADVTLTADDDVVATTDASGIAVLGPLSAGLRTVTLSGGGLSGAFSIMMGAGELHEVAVAADGSMASIMVDIDYKSDDVTTITADMSNATVNDALSVSDRVVFVEGGSYAGDLDLSGSRVTLFGAGARGGEVTIAGNVVMSGSDSRIRGTLITGSLSVPASGLGLSFSQVDGTTSGEGSDATFLANALCGTVSATGSGTVALDNAGMAPITACP